MSESGDYAPAPWAAADSYKDARKAYLDRAARTYGDAVSASVAPSSLVPDALKCEAENPLVIVCDVTGSMGEWPATIFGKLGYLSHELKEYLGDDAEISFAAIGDGPCRDKYPLQVQPFSKEDKLKSSLEKLVHEKGGGGTTEESYDLAALYYAQKCECPNAVRKPIMIFIGDEGIYDTVDRTVAENVCHIKLQGPVKTKSVFEALKNKFNVYAIRKPYGGTNENFISETEKRIRAQWGDFIGEENVLSLPDPERVVDVIFGILGKESGKMDYFEKELHERQLKDVGGAKKVDMVLKSLHSLRSKKESLAKLPPPARAKSVTRRKSPPSKPSTLGDAPDMIDLND